MMRDVDIGERQEGPLEPAIPPCPFCGAEWIRYNDAQRGIDHAAHDGVITDNSCVLAGQIFGEHQFPLLMKRAPRVHAIPDGADDDRDDTGCRS